MYKFRNFKIHQRWVAPSALPSLGYVSIVKSYKSIHKNLSENKKNVKSRVFFLQKLTCLDLQNDIPDFPDYLKSFFFQQVFRDVDCIRMCFLGSRNDCLTNRRGSFIQKIAKIHKLWRSPWTYLSRILENGFQIRIQCIEIGGKPLRIGGLAGNC